MGLKYPVKVDRVNNLSDARYCAGMGVEIIGISSEISVEEAMAITGWITGVEVCLDVYERTEHIMEYIENLKPTYVETNDVYIAQSIYRTPTKVIFRIEDSEYNPIQIVEQLGTQVYAFNMTNRLLTAEQLMDISKKVNLILNIDGYAIEQVEEVCNHIKPMLLALSGGKELAPGLKDFESMAEILEYLETND
ncbi:MAG TPA: hypothetical protein VL947_00195 [Cytophagales bacterium]|nr:hypothetical protein [Cytophagales bacterium]